MPVRKVNLPMDARPRLSIIIPVFDRRERLRACLASLAGDGYQGAAEVIVACDGGPAAMREEADAWTGNWPLVWLQLEKGGPSATRNRTIDKARGEILLFLNDDVILEPGFLTAHDLAHAEQPGHAVVGNTRWAAESVTTDFMHWVAHHDSFFYLVDDRRQISWVYFHTLNCSIDRAWFDHGYRFDESFPDPAFEDTEFGYRLWKDGMRISFAVDAVLSHHHFFEPDDYLRKSLMRGRSAQRLVARFPELHAPVVEEYEALSRKHRWRLHARELLGRRDGPDEWHARFAMAFLAGFHDRTPPWLATRCR